jgi:hypothetical protein
MSDQMVRIAVLAMGALTETERADVNATFAEREPVAGQDFLPPTVEHYEMASDLRDCDARLGVLCACGTPFYRETRQAASAALTAHALAQKAGAR